MRRDGTANTINLSELGAFVKLSNLGGLDQGTCLDYPLPARIRVRSLEANIPTKGLGEPRPPRLELFRSRHLCKQSQIFQKI